MAPCSTGSGSNLLNLLSCPINTLPLNYPFCCCLELMTQLSLLFESQDCKELHNFSQVHIFFSQISQIVYHPKDDLWSSLRNFHLKYLNLKEIPT